MIELHAYKIECSKHQNKRIFDWKKCEDCPFSAGRKDCQISKNLKSQPPCYWDLEAAENAYYYAEKIMENSYARFY
jgi:hypothetical protein